MPAPWRPDRCGSVAARNEVRPIAPRRAVACEWPKFRIYHRWRAGIALGRPLGLLAGRSCPGAPWGAVDSRRVADLAPPAPPPVSDLPVNIRPRRRPHPLSVHSRHRHAPDARAREAGDRNLHRPVVAARRSPFRAIPPYRHD